MLAWTAYLLGSRHALIACFKSQKWPLRLVHASFSFFFLALGLLFTITLPFPLDPVPMLIIAIVVGFSLVPHFYSCFPLNFLYKPFFSFATFLYLVAASFAALLGGFSNLMSENEIASLQLTGKIIKKRVEWKNPDGTVQNQLLDSVQVVITGNAGRELSSQYLYGDLVGVRAKIIRFPSFFNMLGIKNVCYIDALYNGYRSMERHNRFPHQGIALMPATTALGKIWEKVFYRDFDFFWIKAATLESHYFPLFEISGQPKRGSFELTISSSGLSSRKAVQKSAVFHDAARNKNNDFIYTHAI